MRSTGQWQCRPNRAKAASDFFINDVATEMQLRLVKDAPATAPAGAEREFSSDDATKL